MKKILAFLVLGLVLFLTGLLMLFHQATIVSLLSPIVPDIQNVELFGVVIQAIGGLLFVYGLVKLSASEFSAKVYMENRAILLSLVQRVDRIEKRTAEIAERLVSTQNANSLAQSSFAVMNCRFCGANIEKGSSFCPNCGKSQK